MVKKEYTKLKEDFMVIFEKNLTLPCKINSIYLAIFYVILTSIRGRNETDNKLVYLKSAKKGCTL